MKTGILILILCIISFFVKVDKKYLFFSVLVLSGFYLTWIPDKGADLYRHMQSLEYFARASILDLIRMRSHDYGNSMINQYAPSYPIYSLYAHFIGKTGHPEFLAPITCCICYGVVFYVIFSDEKMDSQDNWKKAILFSFILVNMNYLSISGIRNSLVNVLSFFALYRELVQKRNPVVSWCIYISCCFIHSIGVIVLAIRLSLFLYNRFTSLIIKILLLFMGITSTLLWRWIADLSEYGGVFTSIFGRLDYLWGYYVSLDEASRYKWVTMIYTLIFLICGIIIEKFVDSEKKYVGLYHITVIIAFLQIAFYGFDTAFSRLKTVVPYIGYIFFREFLINISAEEPSIFVKVGENSESKFVAIYGIMMYIQIPLYLFFITYTYYRQMDGGMIF